ncbi:MAG: nitroreductase family deazaflavin-dependent oxidoreductase [Pseudomonadales bacterium]
MGVTEYNQSIIEEFRANAGVVGGPFAGANLLLLHNQGAKSGAARVNPLAFFKDGNDLLIVASFAGADRHPPWYYNLLANPQVRVEVGTDTHDATASVVDEPERSALYEQIAEANDAFASYQRKTSRVIPIVRLTLTAPS